MSSDLENSSVDMSLEKVQFSLTPKVGKAKECSNKHALLLLSHVSWVKLKVLQQYIN